MPRREASYEREAREHAAAAAKKVLAVVRTLGPERLYRLANKPTAERSLNTVFANLFGPGGVWVGPYSAFAEHVRGGVSLRDWLQSLPARAAVILWRWKPMYGHWTCVFLQDNGAIQIFDSTAAEPDALRRDQTPAESQALGQATPELIRSLHRQAAHYNDIQLQDSRAQTCGRWCALRLFLRNLTEKEFAGLVKILAKQTKLPPDIVVTAATA